MITAITCSMLESPYISDDDEINTGVSKSTCLESTIKHLIKEARLSCRVSRNLLRRRHITGEKISLTEKSTLEEMIGCSIYNTIKND